MTTLEDKLLGEKRHCYCSSSEEGSDSEGEGRDEDEVWVECSDQPPRPSAKGVSSNTGPKGVIKDWERYKRLEAEKKDKERLLLLEKLSLGARSDPDVPVADDDFLMQYRKQRMKEMFETASLPRFGKLIDLRNGNDFLDAVDNEHKSVTVIIHIYENNVPGCKSMNTGLSTLCKDYPHVKFCKLVGSSAGMSHRFKVDGVPALLVYKSGQLVGNFVRVTDELGDDFYDGDVENFLIEHGMIVDRACVPTIMQSSFPNQNNTAPQNDSNDLSLDD